MATKTFKSITAEQQKKNENNTGVMFSSKALIDAVLNRQGEIIRKLEDMQTPEIEDMRAYCNYYTRKTVLATSWTNLQEMYMYLLAAETNTRKGACS